MTPNRFPAWNIVNGEPLEQHASAPGADTLISHGYTVADPDRLARKAALTSRWRFLPIADRIEIARFAITEHLLTTPEPPEVWSLVTLGRKRSRRTSNPKARYRGVHRAAQTSPRPVQSQCRARSAPPAPNPPPTWFPVPAPIEGLPVCLWCPPRPRISSRAWTAR